MRALKQLQLLARQRMLEYAAVDFEFQKQSYHKQLSQLLQKVAPKSDDKVNFHELESEMDTNPAFRNYAHLRAALKDLAHTFESNNLLEKAVIIDALEQQVQKLAEQKLVS